MRYGTTEKTSASLADATGARVAGWAQTKNPSVPGRNRGVWREEATVTPGGVGVHADVSDLRIAN